MRYDTYFKSITPTKKIQPEALGLSFLKIVVIGNVEVFRSFDQLDLLYNLKQETSSLPLGLFINALIT